MLVRDRMSTPTLTISSGADLTTALKMMEDNALYHLPVLDAAGRLVGMAAERDLLLAATRFLQSSVEVAEFMHRGTVTVKPEAPLAEAARIMATQRIGGLPVVDDSGALVGIVTEADILMAFAETG